MLNYEQLNIFDEFKPITKAKKENDIFAYLNDKYAKYKPHINKFNDYEINISNKIKVRFSKRDGSKYCCKEFQNGYYSVCLDGHDWGESMSCVEFEKACLNFAYLVGKGIKKSNKKIV